MTKLSKTIYAAVLKRIVSGVYQPGDWISVEDLSAEYAISRQPVMEAMRLLSGNWFIEIVPQVGCRVASHDERSLADFIQNFGKMEANVAALAAVRRTVSQSAAFSDLARDLTEVVSSGAETLDAARAFHDQLLRMANSTVLEQLCARMWDFGTFAYTTLATAGIPPASSRERRMVYIRIADAITQMNCDEARRQTFYWLTGEALPMPSSSGA